MRVGVYLGRHAGHGGGIAVYSSALVLNLLKILENITNSEDEIVFYGEKSILTPKILEQILFSEVLATQTESLFSSSAGKQFARLPNGARVRILVRLLPNIFSHKAGIIIDQLMVPFLAYRDRLDILHSTANLGMYCQLGKIPQVVTVHDLFQAWPPSDRADSINKARSKRSGLFRLFYQRFFKRQFARVEAVIVDAKRTAIEIHHRYGFDEHRVKCIPLGIDNMFSEFIRMAANDPEILKKTTVWLKKRELDLGYTLLFASSEPRKNTVFALSAWRRVIESKSNRVLLIKYLDSGAKELVRNTLGESFQKANIKHIDWLDREELPMLFLLAGVFLFPSLAEGFGLPVFEALSLGTVVVSGELENLPQKKADTLYFCDPRSEADIFRALNLALESFADISPQLQLEKKLNRLKDVKYMATNFPRSMADATSDTFAFYREVSLRGLRHK